MNKGKNNKILKKINHIIKEFPTITLSITLIFVVSGIILITLNKLNEDFVKYLITISFILAGFTFFSFFQKGDEKFIETIRGACFYFILAGLSLFISLTLTGFEGDLQFLIILTKFIGLITFYSSIIILVITLYYRWIRKI